MEEENQQKLEQAEKAIEISIESARGIVEKKDAMDRLIANSDFEAIFTVGYMDNESTRLVSLLADIEWQTPEKQASLINDMKAISSLRQYILNIRALGRQMGRQIASSEAQLDDMRTEIEG